ncbi:Protein containing DUF1551 OS=Rhodopirellula maiorica SM1 GN=RMSM_05043 PE=4 SV=1: DUF1551 [Gemmataceae bacterium]|nr:Protein containing DUF1551 OS=Rhodopirellula maiorica SM1 GN=RMSM_05043 PE=4 SV=1: DUF1551 [Gemmataceae bacterium]VTT99680.1 Protein containing DUF1551 OS=Rhodopirellula maiorica SM1 GN=RMSM_05043 PE=4 SV=1: DUF1551 [Gemmataceae bacterium]
MRRIYLGGLALGLGMFASPAAGQDARTAPQQRAARLGRPVAASDAPAPAPVDTGVRPAGLVTPRSGEVPVPSAMPVGGRPTSTPLGSAPVGTPTMSAPQPAGRVIGGPSVVEDRGGVPSPTPTLGTLTYPTALPNGATVVPSVGPEYGSPLPGYEGPVTIGGDCGLAVGDPGIPVMGDAVGRVAGPGRWWATGEYLMWWTQSTSVPTLVTTSSPQFNGILGQGNTTPLVTGSFGQTFHSGGRFGVGRWFGAEQIRGVEARMFFLGQAASTATYTTAMVPFLARPFNNVNPNTPFFGPDSEVVADSTRATGGVQVHLENQLWGAELNYRRNLWGGDPCNPCSPHRLDALVGYRYVNFSEKLTVTENFTTLPGAALPVPFASGVVTDMFRTSNEFHGGQIGLAGSTQRGRWSLDGRAAIAFGTLNRTLYIDGSQNLLMANGMPVTAQGGLLAIPGANIGKYNDSVFSVVPEAGLNIGYQLTSRMKLFVGYNFLYMTNVLRPAGAIDTNLDAARIPNFLATPAAPVPGTPRPAPQFNASGFFVQGISFGVQFNW